MKNILTLFGVFIGWFAVVGQFYLMMENRSAPLPETIIRFFSFFTILTNTLVALYFTALLKHDTNGAPQFFKKPGRLTAITVYITVVGLVYQFVLRGIWEPTGMQKFIDELLHSVIPLFVIMFWWFYEDKRIVKWNQLAGWILYPLVYLLFVLFRGSISGFYPYPFIEVNNLGYGMVILNSLALLIFFLGLSSAFIAIGKKWG